MTDGVNIGSTRRLAPRFARGSRAKAQCPVTGDVVPYDELVKDWRGQWVSEAGHDPKHPLDTPVVAVNPQALHHPRPLLDEGTTDAVDQLVDEPGFATTFGS